MPSGAHRWRLVAAVLALIVATAAAFAPALRAPFEFDDVDAIVNNPTITRLSPLAVPLSPPAATPVAGRPLVNVSFAANYAFNAALGIDQSSGMRAAGVTTSYHVVNLALHIVCGLLLLALLLRTLQGISTSDRERDIGEWLALVSVGIWLLHPLQTEAVDYVTQRTELLVSVWYAATMYLSARAWASGAPRARAAWSAAAVVACFFGMESKEVMLTAPVAVVLYDLAFHLDALRADARTRRRRVLLYVCLCATAVPLVAAVAGGARADSVGFGLGVPWYSYLYSQAWAVAGYLRLAVWPSRLTFDYGQHPIAGLAGVPGAVLLTGLLALSIYAWRRRPRLGFLGCVFFLLLAPSSSVVPIRTEIAAERRMYLALLPLIVALVFGAWNVWKKFAAGVTRDRGRVVAGAALAALLIALGVTTAMRSRVYANSEQLWRDTIRKAPANARAYDQLAATLLAADSTRTDDARQLFATAILVDSTYPYAWTNLADLEVRLGRAPQAQALLQHVLRIVPGYVDATRRLGGVLLFQHDAANAVPLLETVARAQPTVETLGDLATAYSETGRSGDAERTLDQLLSLDPTRVDALRYLAALLIKDHRADAAIDRIGGALRADTSASLLALMSIAQAQAGHADLAASAAAAAARDPRIDPGTLVELSGAMIAVRRTDDAIALLSRAHQLAPNDSEISTRLAMVTRSRGAPLDHDRTSRAARRP